jgi:hypothetical protein
MNFSKDTIGKQPPARGFAPAGRCKKSVPRDCEFLGLRCLLVRLVALVPLETGWLRTISVL